MKLSKLLAPLIVIVYALTLSACGGTLQSRPKDSSAEVTARAIDLAAEATAAVDKPSDTSLVFCYWPAALADDTPAAALFNLQDFAEEMKKCALRHNDLVKWHKTPR